MSIRHQPLVLGIALFAIIVGAGAWLYLKDDHVTPPAATGNTTSIGSQTSASTKSSPDSRKTALEFQIKGDWCKAMEAWQTVLDQTPSTDSPARAEAENNLKLVQPRCNPSEAPRRKIQVPQLPQDKRPREVAQTELDKFYQVGRTIRSVAYLDITGTGSNKDWIFQVDANFAYQYRVVSETRVKERDGSRITFQQDFKEIAQLRAVSDKQRLSLVLPNSPILSQVWKQLEGRVLIQIPIYVEVRNLASIANFIDPGFRGLLTPLLASFQEQLNIGSGDADFVTKLDQFSGTKVQVEYVNGLGVTEIKVLDGPKFAHRDLERLAYSLSLLMDYFVSEAADKPVGQTKEIAAIDVAGMLNFGPDYTIDKSSKITLKRVQPTGGVTNRSYLEIVDGDVTVEAEVHGGRKTANLQPISGLVEFATASPPFIEKAHATWKARTDWVSENHLLFGAENVRNVQMKSYYEASAQPVSTQGNDKDERRP